MSSNDAEVSAKASEAEIIAAITALFPAAVWGAAIRTLTAPTNLTDDDGEIHNTRIDVATSTRAPAATALSTAQWTNARAALLDNLDRLTGTTTAPITTTMNVGAPVVLAQIDTTGHGYATVSNSGTSGPGYMMGWPTPGPQIYNLDVTIDGTLHTIPTFLPAGTIATKLTELQTTLRTATGGNETIAIDADGNIRVTSTGSTGAGSTVLIADGAADGFLAMLNTLAPGGLTVVHVLDAPSPGYSPILREYGLDIYFPSAALVTYEISIRRWENGIALPVVPIDATALEQGRYYAISKTDFLTISVTQSAGAQQVVIHRLITGV